MKTQSIWNTFNQNINCPVLRGDAHTDVVIIGGGIAGLTTALLLSQEGFKVSLVEARGICRGTTSHSTGNLYTPVDHVLSDIKNKHGLSVVKDVLQARGEAFSLIEKMITANAFDCDFKKVPWHLYSAYENFNKKIAEQYEIGQQVGLNFHKTNSLPNTPYPVQSAVILNDQAQFHPLKYGQALAKLVAEKASLYENTPVIDIVEKKDHSEVLTPLGKIITKYVVHATHTPKGIMMVHTLLAPYREYGVACKLKGDHPEGIFWGYYDEENHISTRTYNLNGENYIFVMGGTHKVGQTQSTNEKMRELEKFALKYFNIKELSYRWGGQHYRPADFLPYIGKTHHEQTYIATGFSTDGLIWGTSSAIIIRDEILNRKNSYAKTFRPTRVDPLKSAKNFIKENANVIKQYLKDLPGKTDAKCFEDVKPGEGKVIERDGQKLAVHRDQESALHICSAVCTHMECILKWNDAEKSWDCPCHGSRFNTYGEILEGPAVLNLDNIVINEDHVILKESLWTSPR
jgi:glycine/D-amino acid oxidase-like deaminating enzyme/nitrite reductase/ring-hydroxylating ferredoxin subunit